MRSSARPVVKHRFGQRTFAVADAVVKWAKPNDAQWFIVVFMVSVGRLCATDAAIDPLTWLRNQKSFSDRGACRPLRGKLFLGFRCFLLYLTSRPFACWAKFLAPTTALKSPSALRTVFLPGKWTDKFLAACRAGFHSIPQQFGKVRAKIACGNANLFADYFQRIFCGQPFPGFPSIDGYAVKAENVGQFLLGKPRLFAQPIGAQWMRHAPL